MKVYLKFFVIIGQRFGVLRVGAKIYCKRTHRIVTLIVKFADCILKM